MKKINRHNYEVFFIDFFDNELNEQDTQALFEFLALHSELKNEFDAFEHFSLPIDHEIKLDNKPQLKKHLDETNIEHYIIADLEGELNEDDQQEYTNFISENALYAPTIQRYKRTVLPKESVIFPNKKELKQRSRILVFLPYAVTIAATLILFITLNTNNKTQEYQFQALQDTVSIRALDTDTLIKKTDQKLQNTPKIKLQAQTNNNSNKNKIKTVFKNESFSIPETTDTTSENIKKESKPKIKNITPVLQQPVLEQVDNTLLAENNAAPINKKTLPKENIPTLKQSIHNKIKSSLFKDEANKDQLIDKDYLITTASEKINDSKNILFEQEEEKSRKKTRLKIGKFEFYRDKGV
jgi:hypothetical protein